MKHIAKYRGLRESEGDLDQEIEDLKHLVDLGFAEPGELKAMNRQKYGTSRREEFLALLRGVFAELGITPADYTTSRQEKNGTFYFQLTPVQVEKMLYEYPLPQGLTGKQISRMGRMLREMEPHRDLLRAEEEIKVWQDRYGSMTRSSWFQYFVYPQDIRTASYDRQPNSSGFLKFDGSQGADEILARFIYQLALDAYPWTISRAQSR
jgi:hypothetical protein